LLPLLPGNEAGPIPGQVHTGNEAEHLQPPDRPKKLASVPQQDLHEPDYEVLRDGSEREANPAAVVAVLRRFGSHDLWLAAQLTALSFAPAAEPAVRSVEAEGAQGPPRGGLLRPKLGTTEQPMVL